MQLEKAKLTGEAGTAFLRGFATFISTSLPELENSSEVSSSSRLKKGANAQPAEIVLNKIC